MVLDVEESFEYLELVDFLSKLSLTLLSVYCVICLILVFGFEDSGSSGFTAPSKIHSSGKVISFHKMDLGMTALDFVRSICKSKVSPLLL